MAPMPEGDCDEGSDVDFMIRVKLSKAEWVPYRRGFSRLSSALGLENNILVSIHLQDCDTFERYRTVHAFYRNVEKEGVVLSA